MGKVTSPTSLEDVEGPSPPSCSGGGQDAERTEVRLAAGHHLAEVARSELWVLLRAVSPARTSVVRRASSRPWRSAGPGHNFRRKLGEGDGGVVPVELERRARRLQPLLGAGGPEVESRLSRRAASAPCS